MKYEPLIIRVSKYNPQLVLICNCEKVFRVFLNGVEKLNGLDYEDVSNYFNELEKAIQ